MPLTVGHRDSPIESEVKYMKTIWKLANFLKDDRESEESAVTISGNPPGVASRSASPVNESRIDLSLLAGAEN